jgi:hypothetical protein
MNSANTQILVFPAAVVRPEILMLIAGTPLSEWLQFMASACGLPGQYDYSATSF